MTPEAPPPVATQALGDEEKAKELVAEQTRRATFGSLGGLMRSTDLVQINIGHSIAYPNLYIYIYCFFFLSIYYQFCKL